MCFVNKMDRIGADFYRCLDMIKDRLDANVAVDQLPIGAESEFQGVVDLLTMTRSSGKTAWARAAEEQDIPAALATPANEWRHQLVDVVSQYDENVLEKYVSVTKRSPPTTSAPPSARRPWPGDVVPVLSGTTFKNKGVQPLLDAVVDYLPSPSTSRRSRASTSSSSTTSSATPTTTSRSPRWRSRS